MSPHSNKPESRILHFTSKHFDLLPEEDLPKLPAGWEWEASNAPVYPANGSVVDCWDAIYKDTQSFCDSAFCYVNDTTSLEALNAPDEVINLVLFANGLADNPRAGKATAPTLKRSNRDLALALLKSVLADHDDVLIESAIVLLEMQADK